MLFEALWALLPYLIIVVSPVVLASVIGLLIFLPGQEETRSD